MSVDLAKKMEEFGQAVEAMKKANDERIAAIEKKGSADPLLTAKVDKANDAITKFADEIEGIKTAMNRTAVAVEEKNGGESKEAKAYREACVKFMRKGASIDPALIPAEFKALSDDSNADGGFLVRPELSATIVKKVFESSPMRSLCDSETIGTDTLDIMVDLDESSYGWVAERGSRTSTTTPQIKKATITAQEIYAMPTATQRQLDDAMWNIEAWLSAKVSDKFARTEASAFVSGTGVGQPRGFTTYASGTSYGQIEQVNSGTAGSVTADGLISLLYSLKAPYAQNAAFLMQRATAAAVRKLKDSQNRYIWEPNFQAGSPEMLLGRPLMWANDMAAIASGALAIACGDFKAGYKIVDRAGIRVLRDPYANKGSVQFYTTKRVGGDVIDFDAIKLQKLT